MGYNIGMDFGTTNSTVAWINDTNGHPEAFKYPGVDGYEYIPSCVTYYEDQIAIGRQAFDWFDDPEAVFCSNLKMVLPMSPEQQQETAWAQKKPPETVITDYLRQILTNNISDAPSFTRQKGPIEGIVMSVPHVWAKDPAHKGRSTLQTIVQELGCPLIQLISEPVAAAAYFAYRHQQQEGSFTGNLLVCDMGGGTFDVTLCHIQPGKIEEIFNEGNGRKALGKAGVQFDTRLLTARNLDVNTPDFYEVYKKLQEFKANSSHEITRQILNAIENEDVRVKPILRAGSRYGFTYDDILHAFTDIQDGIEQVMERVKSSLITTGHKVDRYLFVGGFAQFILVRNAIKKALAMTESEIELIGDLNNETARYAIAFGAALIANDLVTVEERYEHTIGICAGQLVKGDNQLSQWEQVLIPVITGGQKLGAYQQPVFAEKEVKSYIDAPPVRIYVALDSNKAPCIQELPHTFELPNSNLPGIGWRVGMRINKSKVVYLIFEDTLYQERREYELGDVIRQMFGTLMVEE